MEEKVFPAGNGTAYYYVIVTSRQKIKQYCDHGRFRLRTLRLDPAGMRLISEFVDNHLRLNASTPGLENLAKAPARLQRD